MSTYVKKDEYHTKVTFYNGTHIFKLPIRHWIGIWSEKMKEKKLSGKPYRIITCEVTGKKKLFPAKEISLG